MLDIATQKSFEQRFSLIRNLKQENLISKKQQSILTIRDIKQKGFFEYSSNTYFVKDINQYEETSDNFKRKKGYFITELTCICIETGQTINFEFEYDDTLEISMTIDRITFRDIKDENGKSIDEDDLDTIADDKDMVLVKGEQFWYEDDFAAVYYRNEKEEKVYMYEFENQAQTKFLTIEEWENSKKYEYQMYISIPIVPNEISVICKGSLNT